MCAYNHISFSLNTVIELVRTCTHLHARYFKNKSLTKGLHQPNFVPMDIFFSAEPFSNALKPCFNHFNANYLIKTIYCAISVFDFFASLHGLEYIISLPSLLSSKTKIFLRLRKRLDTTGVLCTSLHHKLLIIEHFSSRNLKTGLLWLQVDHSVRFYKVV